MQNQRISPGTLLFVAITALVLTQCGKDDDAGSRVDCASVICTQEFVMLLINVEDRHGVNIPLDSFEITDRDNGETITPEYTAQQMEQFRLQGEYPLYDDSFVPEPRQKERFISFRGFKDGEAVVS